ncbi:MAG: RNA 2',3'-cyclic phosphodiesterase [Solirubrobacterales bacterium]|nr:RNA 2',3'-cyclic phosphodiesterase [Solirubrobacterales bacterium]
MEARPPRRFAETERRRLFVALELPEHVRDSLCAWRSEVMADDLRPVAPEGLHVTLCFLGGRPADQVPAIAAACETALEACSISELGLQAGLWLPRRHPRVLAVRLADPSATLGRAQGALSDALDRGGWYTPEKRPFLPHVTVARIPARARVRAMELPELPPLVFRAPAVTLYRSRLQRTGAVYEPLASVPVGE